MKVAGESIGEFTYNIKMKQASLSRLQNLVAVREKMD